MIRLVTRSRLVGLQEEAQAARSRATHVQAQAIRSLADCMHEAWELTARAEAAESQVAAAQREVAGLRRELDAAKRTGVTLWLLLHHGDPHSIHRTTQAAEEHAESCEGAPIVWEPGSGRPASEVTWRMTPVTVKEGADDFLAP
ncbi:hypothetical protein [Streptomyces griseocarneus]|uniref:hypothetical protein n=1 Tax=Streptomyces griseocarneus TaxID=51201 RepID=UPI00167EBA90|nr:hypothetical protein [Streptomyces griseocarneus]MBZ6477506.1 hypothetical protein [Streptomyces griseocarneus]GHG82794.1 hypothetical protein GCM10018779_65730 [Streptomyces griseocarneus]